MQAEVIAIGTELLLGQIVDTNSSHIAQRLREAGVNVFFTHCVGDNEGRIYQVLDQALDRSDALITTGGLGPTEDDVTRQVVARVMGVELEFQPHLFAQIEAIFRKAQLPMTDGNRQQAYIPAKAIPIENPKGTAPGFIAEGERGVIIALPGVPYEMEYLLSAAVIPYLTSRFNLRSHITYRTLRTSGIGESSAGDRIRDLMRGSNPTVGTLAGAGEVRIRIAARAEDEQQARELIRQAENTVRERLGDYIYGADEDTLEGVVSLLLQEAGKTVALVETISGGALSQRFSRSGAFESIYREGLICPNEAAQSALLHLSKPQPTDGSLAERMAQAVRDRAGAHIGLAVVGDLAPHASTELVNRLPAYVAMATEEGTWHRRLGFGGGLPMLQTRCAIFALDMVRRLLSGLAVNP